MAERRAANPRNVFSCLSWRFGLLASAALFCALLFFAPGCSTLDKPRVIQSGPEDESAGEKLPRDHPKLPERIRAAQKILTEDVRHDFHERNERESARLVCAVLRPPYQMVLLHMLGKQAMTDDSRIPLEPEQIKSRRAELLEELTARVRKEVSPESWKSPNVLIDARENHLLVFQTLEVVQSIYRYLDEAEKATPMSRTNIRLRVTEAVCAPESGEKLRKQFENGAAPQPTAASEGDVGSGKTGDLPDELPVEEQHTIFCVALNGERAVIRHRTPRQYIGDMLPFYSEGQFSIWQERREVKEGSELAFVARTSPGEEDIRVHFRYRRLKVVGWDTNYVAGGLIRSPKVDAHELESTARMPEGRRILVGGPRPCHMAEENGSDQVVLYFATAVCEEPGDQPAPRRIPPELRDDGPATIVHLPGEDTTDAPPGGEIALKNSDFADPASYLMRAGEDVTR